MSHKQKHTLLLLLFTLLSSYLVAQIGDTTKARAYLKQAQTALEKGQKYEEVINNFERAANIYKSAELWDLYLTAEYSEGRTLIVTAQYTRAEALLKDALDLGIKKLGKQSIPVSKVYATLGELYTKRKDFITAVKYFKEALGIFTSLSAQKPADLDLQIQVAKGHNNVGVVYGYMGDADQLLINAQKSLEIYQKLAAANPANQGLQSSLATAYNNIAKVYLMKKDRDKQLEYLMKALALWQKSRGELHENTAKGYFNLSMYYNDIKDPANEMKYLQKCIDIRIKLSGDKNPDLVKAYQNMADCYFRQGDKVKALQYYENAVNILIEVMGESQAETGYAFSKLASFYKRTGDIDKALQFTQRSFTGLANGFDSRELKDNPSIKKFYLSRNLLNSLSLKGELLRLKGNNDELAFETFTLALNLIDSLQANYTGMSNFGAKAEMSAACLPVYENAIATAKSLYDKTKNATYLSKAFDFMERGKSFLLLESLRDLEAKSFGGVPDSLVAKENNLKANIANAEKSLYEAQKADNEDKVEELEKECSRLRTDYGALVSRLQKEYPRYYDLKYDNRTAALSDVQNRMLSRDAMLLQYFVGDSTTYVFAVTTSGANLLDLGKSKVINQKILAVRKAFSDPAFFATQPQEAYTLLATTAHDLYNLLLAPALQNQSGVKRLIVSPDGLIGLIPFEALLYEKAAADGTYSTLAYLIKQYAVSYTYCATLRLKNMDIAHGSGKKCLAFAPTYNSNGVADTRKERESGDISDLKKRSSELPGALKEVKSISDYFSGKYYEGRQATKANFFKEIANYDVLHLAMHGTANDQNPMFSSLTFAGDTTDSEALYAYEVLGLKLNAGLVVLSACETGVGKYQRGEGVMSFARAFMNAGIPSVVLTLWKVNDNSSEQIMVKFYKYLSEGQSKDDALRQAKLDYLAQAGNANSHPFYWAGFVAFGDTSPLGGRSKLWWWIGGLVLAGGAGAWALSKRKA